MAPDLSSVPPSAFPAHQSPMASPLPRAPSHSGSMFPPPQMSPRPTSSVAIDAFGADAGPTRHPRPLTAAELHSEMEREQEAVVNRLTRELSALRAAQNASVQSNCSSVSGTGTGFPDPTDANSNHIISGPSHPSPSIRPGTNTHNRSSSSTSSVNRSRTASLVSVANATDGTQSSRYPLSASNNTLSRQNSNISTTSSRPSEHPSPAVGSYQSDYMASHYPLHLRRQSLPRRDTNTTNTSTTAQYATSAVSVSSQDTGGPTLSIPATERYEQAAYWRLEWEKQREENERLKMRIRELEGQKKERQPQPQRAQTVRTDSVDTNVSVQGSVIGREREVPTTPLRAAQAQARHEQMLEREIQAGETAATAAT